MSRNLDTLPRKPTFLRRFRKKPGKTVAEVGLQVGGSGETQEQKLQRFMDGISTEISQLQENCAKRNG